MPHPFRGVFLIINAVNLQAYFLDINTPSHFISVMDKDTPHRQEIVWVGQNLHAHGLISGMDGNISYRLDENRFLITPTGRPKGELEPGELIIIDNEGNLVEGDSSPSSEYKMHLAIYRMDKKARAVVHAHPPITTAFSVAGQKFPADLLPEGVIALSNMVWIDYATPSTEDLPYLMSKHLPDADIFVLKSHGVTTTGETLEEAYFKMETCEHQAKTYFYARLIGEPQTLPPDEVQKIQSIYGKKDLK